MSRARRIALNTAWLTLAQGLATVAAVFVVGYVARELGSEGFGELEGAISFAILFSPIVFAGIQLILVREVVGHPERAGRALGDALVIRLLMLPLFAVLVWFLAPLVVPQIRPVMIALAVVNSFALMYGQSLSIPIEAAERMHFMAWGTVLLTVVAMVLSVVAVVVGWGPEGVLGARISGMVVCMIFLAIVVLTKFCRPQFDLNLGRLWTVLRQGIPLAIQFLLGLVLLEVDKAMLARMTSLDQVGEYGSATVLAYKFEMIILAFQTALVPSLVAAWSEGAKAYEALLGRALRFALILGLPFAVGTGFVAPALMVFIFGEGYLAAAPLLATLMWFVPCQFVNRVLASSLAASHRERWVALAVAVAVAANIGLNALFIPRYGHHGAAWATVATEVLLAVLYLGAQRQQLRGMLGFIKLPRVLLAVGVMAAACYAMSSLPAPVVIVGAAVVYGGAVLLLRAVDREEVRALTGR
jgi:O-antigen/teichoic acid export membrane protein